MRWIWSSLSASLSESEVSMDIAERLPGGAALRAGT